MTPTAQRATAVFPGLHVAIIMDGNGRWAQARRRPRTFGHREGARTVRRVVEAAPGLGVGVLTLYAFSSDNWSRPAPEVRTLMRLFQRHLIGEADELAREGVRLQVIGRRDRLPPAVLEAIRVAEARTSEQKESLLAFFRGQDDELKKKQGQVAEAKKPRPIDPMLKELQEKLARVEQPLPPDPTLTELERAVKLSTGQLEKKRLTAAQDLAWALINNPAFLFNR